MAHALQQNMLLSKSTQTSSTELPEALGVHNKYKKRSISSESKWYWHAAWWLEGHHPVPNPSPRLLYVIVLSIIFDIDYPEPSSSSPVWLHHNGINSSVFCFEASGNKSRVDREQKHSCCKCLNKTCAQLVICLLSTENLIWNKNVTSLVIILWDVNGLKFCPVFSMANWNQNRTFTN